MEERKAAPISDGAPIASENYYNPALGLKYYPTSAL